MFRGTLIPSSDIVRAWPAKNEVLPQPIVANKAGLDFVKEMAGGFRTPDSSESQCRDRFWICSCWARRVVGHRPLDLRRN